MNSMAFYVLLYLFSTFTASASQIMLKKSTHIQYDSILKEYLNPQVIIAYGIFFLSSLLTVTAYRGVPMSMGPVLESTGYIYVAVLGVLILHEKMTKKKILGNILIIAGILVFALL